MISLILIVSRAEKISQDQLSLGIVQSCSVLLFLNDEVSFCRMWSILIVDSLFAS